MANVYAVKTGNWSDTTVWNTSALPTSADDVYANTYTVTIDQDVTIKSLRNGSATGITAGGGFACSTARTIDCSAGAGIVVGGGSNLLVLTVTTSSPDTCTIKAAITTNGSNFGTNISFTGTGTLSVIGNVSCSNTSGIIHNSSGTLNVTGSVSSTQTGNAGNRAIDSSNGACYIVGNVSLSSNTNQDPSGIVNITSYGSLTGSVTGNTNANALQPTVTVNNSLFTITGTLTASTTYAVVGGSNGVNVSGPFICSGSGLIPINGKVKLTGAPNNEFRFAKSTGGTTSLWSSDVNSGAPSAANVRSGTKFGVSNEFTGTLAVPAAGSVALGVPVDNTTGTAVLRTSDVANIVSAITTAALDSVE